MFIRDNNLNHIFLNAFVKKRKLTENKKNKGNVLTPKIPSLITQMHENAFLGAWGPFLESPGNFSRPKTNITIEI